MKNKKDNLIWSIIITIFLILIFVGYHIISPAYFYVNDDVFIRRILSGEYSGTPESYLAYINIIPGFFISSLYKICYSIPWYGLSLVLCMFASFWFILHRMISLLQTVLQRILCLVISICPLLYLFYQFWGNMQYTTITMITVCGAIFLAFTCDIHEPFRDYYKHNIGILVLLFLSGTWRYFAFLSLLPFVIAPITIKFLFAFLKNKENRSNLIKNFTVLLSYILVLTLFIGGTNYLFDHSQSNRDYASFNEARTDIVDYLWYPDYQEVTDICEKYGVSEASYQAALTFYCLEIDTNITTEFYHELIEFQQTRKASVEEPHNFSYLFKTFTSTYKSYVEKENNEYFNTITLFLYALLILLVLTHRKWEQLCLLLSVHLCRTVIWFYLFLKGRVISRVTDGIWAAEFIALVALLFCFVLYELRYKKVAALLLFVLSLICIKLGTPSMTAVKEVAKTCAYYEAAYTALYEQLDHNPDTLYLCDLFSFYNDYENALRCQTFEDKNYYFLGGWMARSPYNQRKLSQYGINDLSEALLDDQSNVYYLSDITDTRMYYLYTYYYNMYGNCTATIVKEIQANDFKFVVMKFHVDK